MHIAHFLAPLSASDTGIDNMMTPAKRRGAIPQRPHSAQP